LGCLLKHPIGKNKDSLGFLFFFFVFLPCIINGASQAVLEPRIAHGSDDPVLVEDGKACVKRSNLLDRRGAWPGSGVKTISAPLQRRKLDQR
jgi:hypothetical protein